jgi:F0F1-type ATP synthase assembly protein I
MGDPIGSKSSTDPEGGALGTETGVLGSDAARVNEAERIETQANSNAASRAIAVMILMIVPGVLGSYLDKWLGTQFFIVVGFVAGIGIAIFGLLYVARIADLAAKKSRELRHGTSPRGRDIGANEKNTD